MPAGPPEGFDPIEIVALWHGAPTPLIRTVLEQAQRFVREQWPQWACSDKLG
ncbi:MAG: hypothetical protein PHQ04_01465 [Opitutaceae bacterium]|nr:hypothetical protein [Opitutaceae bacterium]